MIRWFVAGVALAGSAAGCPLPTEPGPRAPVLDGEPEQIVPRAGLPEGVAADVANNNLDIVQHEGRLYFAFRTAPSHFASADARMYVMSREPGADWIWEATIALGSDVREPRFLSWDGELRLFFAQLGNNPAKFEPQGAFEIRRLGEGNWTPPEPVFEEGFIPWRARVLGDVPYVLGYTGGGAIYEGEEKPEPVRVSFLTTEDGVTWRGVDPARPVVLEGGASETDFAFQDDGSLLAVSRNELGDPDGFGSLVCKAPANALASWSCVHDPKKYDSPIVFAYDGAVWLIGRRHLSGTGNYDLFRDDIPYEDRARTYEIDYWGYPKRCSLWKVDGETQTVSFVLDLPSRGDTCFPGVVPYGEEGFLVYNYSSPLDGDDLTWLEGQLGPTNIYAHRLIWR